MYRIDPDGAWTLLQTLETVPNPQFIAFDRQQQFLYSVHGDGTEVSAYAIDKPSGRLKFLNKQPTNGNNSTHLTPDPSNRYIVIGNGPGVAVFPINPDGSLSPFSDMVPAKGEVGPHRNQTGAGPHPHYVSFDPSGRFLVAPDRGTDRVLIYRLDAATGKLAANDPAFARTRRGAGPRHLAFHPAKPWAYVCDELNSTVTAYVWNSERGELKAFQVIAAQPDTYMGNNSPAEIQVAPVGKFRLRVEPRAQQHRDLQRRSGDRAAGTGRLGADARPHAALLYPRSDRRPALRGQPGEPQHRCFPGRSKLRQADADRPDRGNRQPVLHHFRARLMPAARARGGQSERAHRPLRFDVGTARRPPSPTLRRRGSRSTAYCA